MKCDMTLENKYLISYGTICSSANKMNRQVNLFGVLFSDTFADFKPYHVCERPIAMDV